jgi:acyl-CoA thioesterase 8
MQSTNAIEENLELNEIDINLYQSAKPLWHPPGARGIFGGSIIAQALWAAVKTVDSRLRLHSMHSYFILKGDSTRPVLYQVLRVRDGKVDLAPDNY